MPSGSGGARPARGWRPVAVAALAGAAWPAPAALIGIYALLFLTIGPMMLGYETRAHVGQYVLLVLLLGVLVGLWWLGRRLLRRAGAARPATASGVAVAVPAAIGFLGLPVDNGLGPRYLITLTLVGAVSAAAVTFAATRAAGDGVGPGESPM
ncbi:hypothetical protein [Haloechinothrix alba]|nr:hypothetical protein [Haloechinothrix alba]